MVENPTVVSRFFAHEWSSALGELLLDAIEGRDQQTELRSFEFNLFDVLIDFRQAVVTLQDVLDEAAPETIPLPDFEARLRGMAARSRP